jgi:putative hemolysin
MRFALTLSALLVLAGCTTTAPATAPSVADAATDAAQCAATGGQMQPLGRLQREQCVVAYADAGKACSRKSDCSGQCLASGDEALVPGAKATGTCQRDVSQNFGCRQRIDGGVAQGTICVD